MVVFHVSTFILQLRPRNEGFFFVLIDDKRYHQKHC